jgi:hypothetical protein
MMSTTNFQLVSMLSIKAVIILLPLIGLQGLVTERFVILPYGRLCEHGTKMVYPNYQGYFTEFRR